MNKLRIYIVEDEPLIVATIETALLKHGFKVVGDADEVGLALTEINSLQPDLVLLDIQLQGLKDGIDLAMQLSEKDIPYLFLTSQTDKNTIGRIKDTAPVGYIAKPFTENGLRSNIEIAWHNYTKLNPNYLTIRFKGKLHRLAEDSILYLNAYDNYCYIFTKTEKYLVPHTLKHIFQQLKSKFFIKSHRSYVVNINYIKSVGNQEIVLPNTSIPLSSSHRQFVIEKTKGE